MKVYFHPNLQLLVAEKRTHWGGHDSIHVVDVPAELTPFEGSDLTDKNLKWPMELLRSTCVHALKLQHTPHYRAFRRNGGEWPVLDVISKGGLQQDVSHTSISGLEGPTPKTSSHNIQVEPKKDLLELRTTAGHTICLGRRQSYGNFQFNSLAFMRMPSGDREKASWIGLKVPEEVKGVNAEVLAFDDVYGTLLLDDAVGSYCIVQY